MVQSTGFPSITAAAEGPVTFGCFFYRWKARLLSGWGSSSAQGNGGRVRTPAPTMYPKVRSIFCRARCPHRAVSGRPRCAAPDLGGPRAHSVRPYREHAKCKRQNILWKGNPPPLRGTPFDNGGFGRRAFFRSKSCLSREHPHPPPSGAPSPLKGEGLRAATWGRPYGRRQSRDVGSANSGADLEPHQEQILQTQGPVARREVRHPLKFCAPETMHTLSGVRPP